MAHSVDHTVDEILMSANTYLLNSEEVKYPIFNIADFLLGLYLDSLRIKSLNH